jgi:2-iminobutanoate/2-iminopropanoate deaminase
MCGENDYIVEHKPVARDPKAKSSARRRPSQDCCLPGGAEMATLPLGKDHTILENVGQERIIWRNPKSAARSRRGAFTGKAPIMTIRLFAAAALSAWYSFVSANAFAAEFVEGTDRIKARAYSPAVITDGGRIVWLAGMGGITEADGKPINDFAGQTRRAFQNIEATLKKAGGTLADIVTMTVFIRNQADGDEFVKIRAEILKSGFPASALITAKDFAVPQLLVEIQAIAVIGERN